VVGAGVRLPLRKLNAELLRTAIRAAMERRPGAQRVARAFADAGGPESAADALEELADRAGSDRD
jgi:UDP:flavonoid glycosyltransferase YjiC (YdhE family)